MFKSFRREVAALPILIGVGPVRSGSTWVHQLFLNHPEASVTKTKEVNFFRSHYEAGFGWYLDQFKQPDEQTKILVDMSPSGLGWTGVADRIKVLTPNPYILIGLRSPYERLMSYHLRFSEPSRSFTDMAEEYHRISGFGPIAARIHEYAEKIGKERIVLFNFDDLTNAPLRQSRWLQAKFGLSYHEPPSATHRVNSAPTPGGGKAWQVASAGSKVLARTAPGVWYKLRYSKLYDDLHGIVFPRRQTNNQIGAAEIESVFRKCSKVFEPDIDALEKILNAGLCGWRFDAQCGKLPTAAALHRIGA